MIARGPPVSRLATNGMRAPDGVARGPPLRCRHGVAARVILACLNPDMERRLGGLAPSETVKQVNAESKVN
jgi:hypothetical protein